MQQVHDVAGEPLQFVVEVVGEMIDALVGAIDAAADLGEMIGLLVAQLVQLGPKLPQKFFQLLLEGRAPLEMVDDLEEDEKDRGEGGGVDQP